MINNAYTCIFIRYYRRRFQFCQRLRDWHHSWSEGSVPHREGRLQVRDIPEMSNQNRAVHNIQPDCACIDFVPKGM